MDQNEESLQNMSAFEVCVPSETDAARIASIHLDAMDDNPLLHAQFPTAASLKSLEEFLHVYTLSELRDPKTGILIARSADSGCVAAFAKWEYPSSGGDEQSSKLETGDLMNLEACRREFLEQYAALADRAKERAFGNRPCYRLTFVCTHPDFQGCGAGSLLTREVMKKAATDQMPIYLESTLVAVGIYDRLGFKTIDRFEMKIPQRGGDGNDLTDLYEEVCMVWWPNGTRAGLTGREA